MFYFCANKLVKKTIVSQCNLALLFNTLNQRAFSIQHKNYSVLNIKSFNSTPMDIDTQLLKSAKSELLQILDCSISSVLPGNLIDSKVKYQNDQLIINDIKYPLPKNVYIAGFGKAVAGMAFSLERIICSKLQRGILSVPSCSFDYEKADIESFPNLHEQQTLQLQHLKMLKGSDIVELYKGSQNNQPDEAAHKNTKIIVKLVENLGKDDLLIVLISGGGSALLFQPRAPLTSDSKRDLCRQLQNAGANITELNRVRMILSKVKGGGLAEIAYPAKILSLVLSDIINDPLDFIASGPTSFIDKKNLQAEALDVLKKYNLFNHLDEEVKKLFTDPNTIVPNKAEVEEGQFSHVKNIIIGNNEVALLTAKATALNFNLKGIILSNTVQGDVRDVSLAYAYLTRTVCFAVENQDCKSEDFVNSIMKQTTGVVNINQERLDEMVRVLKDFKNEGGLLLLAGGEPTVVVNGDGIGGRNQELALRFSIDWLAEIAKNPLLAKYFVLFLSAGTDGQDGPTDAAGAFGRPAIRPIIAKMKQDLVKQLRATVIPDEQEDLKCQIKQIDEMLPENVLIKNDSYNFYCKFEDGENLLKTGHTGTNVMDLHFIYIKKRNCECNIHDFLNDENKL